MSDELAVLVVDNGPGMQKGRYAKVDARGIVTGSEYFYPSEIPSDLPDGSWRPWKSDTAIGSPYDAVNQGARK